MSPPPTALPIVPPASALVVRPDTLGDLVLFAPTLGALRAAWPRTRLAVVIRRAYLDLARLLVPGVEWIATDLDPFVQGPAEAETELIPLRQTVAALAPDLVVAACPRRHWLDTALAAAAPRARRVAFCSNEEDPYFGVQMRSLMGQAAGQAAGRAPGPRPGLPSDAPFFPEVAAAAPGEQDWQRNFGLAEHLLGRPVERTPPRLEAEAAALSRADGILRALGLEPGKFVACAAAGFANVRIKTWPAERYGAVLGWLKSQHGVRTLLVGQESERTHLESVAAGAGAAAAVWTGGAGDLPLLAALLARSALYFGNDTGAMHLAAALGRPTVAIFGGGTWPRFQPAARRALLLVHPLPCFGCGWECPFGDAPCIQAIGEADVRAALTEFLPGSAPACEIRAVQNLPAAVVTFMGRTAAQARERTAAHLAREHKLEAIAFLAGEKDGEIEALKAAADEKDTEIVALKVATDEKDAEIESKDVEIASLKQATDEKDAEIESKDAEIVALKAATDEKDAEIESKDAEIAALAKACEERLQLIIRLDGDLKRYVQEVGRLQAEAKK